MFIKKLFIFIIILLSFSQCSLGIDNIKAQNNAYWHNNKGLIYLEEKYYFGAIKEFQIAIDLNPNSQASAVFYTNLGKTYEKIGYYDLAKPCFEKAVSLNILCFDYYLKMVENYKKHNIIDEKLNQYKSNKSSPLNEVVVGLLYIQKGETKTGITMLDEFCNKEPNLLITSGIKKYLEELSKN